MAPEVSVVMSVYNGERYLREAVESILNQTFTDFEFIIIDDGSTDGTEGILASYHDSRIVLLRNAQNIGLTRSLNRGLAIARGAYIARADADDISLPERLAVQIAFLTEHRNVGLVGSAPYVIDAHGSISHIQRVPVDDLEIKWLLLFHNTFAHGSVMFRRGLLDVVGAYCVEKVVAQDYDLWVRIACSFAVANLALPLICWRDSPTGISRLRPEAQAKCALEISVANLSTLVGEQASPRELIEQLCHLGNARFSLVDPSTAPQVVEALWSVYQIFVARYQLDRPDAPKMERKIKRWIRERIVGLAGYWGEHGYRTLCWRLLRDLLFADAWIIIASSTYRALARAALGQKAARWLRSGLQKVGTVRRRAYEP